MSFLFTRLRQFLTLLFGDFSWQPPGWLRHGATSTHSWVSRHRCRTAALSIGLLALAATGWWSWHWYQHRPRPVTITVKVLPLRATPMADKLFPEPIIILFGGSVARLEDQGTDRTASRHVYEGVHLSPSIPGEWTWVSDDRLVFHPKNDWPAATRYEITLDRSLFPEHVLLETYRTEVTTAPLVATMPKLEFYTDPTDPATKQVVATFEFTHPVDPAALKSHLALSVIGGSEIFAPEAPPFTITAGKHQRLLYFRTSALTLPEREDFLRLALTPGLTSTLGGAPITTPLEKKVLVPDLYSFFKIQKTQGEIVRNPQGEPEQILIVETRGAAKSEELQKALHVYLLPKKPDGEKEWKSPAEIEEETLQKAVQLPLKLLPQGRENAELHSFRISLETTGQLYVTIDKGVKAMGGYVLGEAYASVLPVPVLPREIEIQGEGGVLALNGERKLSIKSRGVTTIEYEVARVPADQINHLVSQTRGEFQNPEFVNYHFGREDIARLATEKQTIAMQSRFKANYSAFDLGKHLHPATDGGPPLQGLFFVKAREWHEPKKPKAAAADTDGAPTTAASERAEGDPASDADEAEEESDGDSEQGEEGGDAASAERFILVTDLGLVVKENADGSRDLFVASIKTGRPVGGVSVELLAKNGVPLLHAETAADGHLAFPSLGKPTREKTPVAFVARRGDDVAFMPYARADRKLDYSRFETGGVESRSGSELDAFLFTERGLYRPGDLIHVGLMVKQRDWAGKLEGLPIETEVIDARGTSVQVRKFALPAMGFAETTYQTSYESPTGSYTINAYLVHDGKRGLFLGETSVIVKEFLPDRLKIESHLSREAKTGWITPEGITASVRLFNLYGTPATERRLKGKITLSPSDFGFDDYPDYHFYDPQANAHQERKHQEIELGDQQTDANGAGQFNLELERFAGATYALTFSAEGFEAGGGRSVTTTNSLLISSLPYVVGAKTTGDFGYLPKDTPHQVEWLALDPTLKPIALADLECRLTEFTYVSVLTKDEDGTYKYESVESARVIRTEQLSLAAGPTPYALPTEVPGRYALGLYERAGGQCVSTVSFTVVGRGAVSRSLEKNAELQVKLSRNQYSTGEEIELAVVAPFTGSGLITIERDKVYAYQWFQADRTSTVQHIRVPADFEGTGYVNVCFVRGLDSKEVFMSPLSYAAVPFQANLEKRRLPITLRAAAKSRPGEPLRIAYKTDRPARIAVFAVDQGILQVSDYHLPEPLAHFFRKAALMVQTRQIVDLILPEFSILRSLAAFGGDGEKLLNPFKRVTEKPVVFWSGILEAGPREQEVVYEVPDYFSGTLTIMAVALSPDAVGSIETSSLIRGPFVLTPNVPTVAAPGDVFDVSLTVANGVEGSGEKAEVQVRALPSEHLEIVRGPVLPLLIDEGREISTTFTVRAREKFGSASLVFQAQARGQEAKLRSTLSVRPPVPYLTSVQSGRFTGASAEVKIERTLHADFRQQEATLSALPLGLARGLDAYLHHYPNGCSEQITSGAFSRLLLADEVDFGLLKQEVHAQLEKTFATLRQRQNDQGSFGYWTVDQNDRIDFVSVYVMHFLIEAKAAGFAPPAGLLQTGLKHLQAIVALDPASLREARIQAYAIYLLTREGVVTTNYALNLRDYLDQHEKKRWRQDLTSAYLAGTWALLKKTEEAEKLFKGYQLGRFEIAEAWDFHGPLGSDAQYLALLCRHAPELLKRVTPTQFEAITRPISRGEFSTLSAAYAVLALKSYSHLLAPSAPQLSLGEIRGGGAETPVRLEGGALLKRAPFSAGASLLRFHATGPLPKLGLFYQAVQAGYDTTLPSEPVHHGLEVFRELLDTQGHVTETAKLGEPIIVRLRLRSLARGEITNVAIVDLLPGGFEFVSDDLKPGAGSAGFDYVDLREDRAVFFGTVGDHTREVRYQIKATNRGDFVFPPAFAESMYDRAVQARGLPGKVHVIDAP